MWVSCIFSLFSIFSIFSIFWIFNIFIAYRMRLIQLGLNSIRFLQWPNTLWKRCFQNRMERCINSPYMKVKCIGLKCAYITYFAYLSFFLSHGWRSTGGFLLDFCWIDPMVTAERIAAKSQYAVRYISHMQNMYNMQNHVNKCIFCIWAYEHILYVNFAYSAYKYKIRWTESGPAGHSVYSSVQQQPGSYCPVRHPPHRAYTAQGSHACLIVAVCAEEIAVNQSPGHGVYPPAWNIWWGVSAQDG